MVYALLGLLAMGLAWGTVALEASFALLGLSVGAGAHSLFGDSLGPMLLLGTGCGGFAVIMIVLRLRYEERTGVPTHRNARKALTVVGAVTVLTALRGLMELVAPLLL